MTTLQVPTARETILELRQAVAMVDSDLCTMVRAYPEANRPHVQRAWAAMQEAQRELLEAWFAEPAPERCAYCGRDAQTRQAPGAHSDMGRLCPDCYEAFTPVGCLCVACEARTY